MGSMSRKDLGKAEIETASLIPFILVEIDPVHLKNSRSHDHGEGVSG